MDADLCIIIVSWNVRPLLLECLRSIHALAADAPSVDGTLPVGPYSVQVVVVDNASSDASASMVRDEFPAVRLVESSTNLGFTRANNLALQRTASRYVLLLNPDTRLVAAAGVGEPLSTMLDYMELHPQVGVLGPQLRNPDGSIQSSRRRFPSLMTGLMESTLLEQWFPHNRWSRAYHMADTPDDAVQEVGWVTGACLLVRRVAIERVGGLDESFFMYSEELDWCRRIADAGWRIVYLPTAVVVHHEGQSSARDVSARHVHFQSSKVHYFRKHHGVLCAKVLRLFLLSSYVVQLAEEGSKWLLRSRPQLRSERLRTYWRVLRSGLRSPTPPADDRMPVTGDSRRAI